MRSALMAVLVVFLAVNVGVIYYILLFGDVPAFERRIGALEGRVNRLFSLTDLSEKAVGIESEPEKLVVLSSQQEEQIVDRVLGKIEVPKPVEPGGGLINQQETVSENKSEPSRVKQVFVPVGSARATTQEFGWKSVPVEATFDLADFGEVAEVRFEGTLRVPSGNGKVEARLVDTKLGVVGGSTLEGEGVEGVFARSEPLIVASGERTLKLEMRTSLEFEGVLENGRLNVKLK